MIKEVPSKRPNRTWISLLCPTCEVTWRGVPKTLCWNCEEREGVQTASTITIVDWMPVEYDVQTRTFKTVDDKTVNDKKAESIRERLIDIAEHYEQVSSIHNGEVFMESIVDPSKLKKVIEGADGKLKFELDERGFVVFYGREDLK